MENESLLKQIEGIVGPHIRRERSGFPLTEWKAPPLAVVAPGTVEEVCEVARAAEAAKAAIVPFGGATLLHVGYPPEPDRPYLLLSTARLAGVQDFQPDDLTITAGAGTTLAETQAAMASRRQRLALDSPQPEKATLGGIIATNAAGFWRAAYGTPRDLLIGMKAVMADGVAVKGGGRVVKNVAGYDVCKLFTGSWGAIGIITEATFRVRTMPEAERTLTWVTPDLASAARHGLSLHHARLAATFVLATNEIDGKPRLALGLHGDAGRVAWQAEEFARRLAQEGLKSEAEDVSEETLARLRDRQNRNTPFIGLAARIACLPSECAALTARLSELPAQLTVQSAVGILSLAADYEPSLVQEIQKRLPQETTLVWTRIPAQAVELPGFSVWGEKRGDFALQQRLKETLDPRKTFSPGRFVGRL